MKPLIHKLAVAALVLAILPAAAAARDCDRDRDPIAYPAPQPYPYPEPAPGWQGDRRPWGEGSWRWRELAEIRGEMRDLDARRAEFYARWGWRPGQVRRFERWYAWRRAELERRAWELQRVAWR